VTTSEPAPTGSKATEPTEITAHTILPAQRENIELKTADGLTLVGELALPPAGRPPVATLVTLHPLPTHAGMMDSHIFRKAAWRLPALADLAVLRFNTRGTTSARGTSEGHFGDGIDERHDVAAAIDFVDDRELPNPWLVGWSFGTELTLMYGCEPQIQGAILLSPPLHRANETDIQRWADSAKPVRILVPELDDYLRPEAARQRFAALLTPEAKSQGSDLIAVDGAKHLWVGEKYVRTVLDEIVRTTNPVAAPLPTTYDTRYGPAEKYTA
jgi:alpha/beta superfamily hydrolase